MSDWKREEVDRFGQLQHIIKLALQTTAMLLVYFSVKSDVTRIEVD